MKYLKRTLSYLLLLTMICASVPVASVQAKGVRPVTQSRSYYVMDATTGSAIAGKNVKKRIYPASTVKLMTAMVALEHADTADVITYTKAMKKQVPYDASAINLRTGRSYTVEQYIYMLLMKSDADSAIALAVGISGSYDRFVQWMNNKARKLGMNKSHFDNPMGLDKGSGYAHTYTTASDFAKMARAAMQNKTIRKVVKTKRYRIRPIGVKNSFVMINTNAFYSVYKKMVKKADYKIIGSKTGTTNAAGHTLIATARNSKGKEIIVVFFGKSSHEQLYRDVKKLFDYAYAQ